MTDSGICQSPVSSADVANGLVIMQIINKEKGIYLMKGQVNTVVGGMHILNAL